LLVRRAEINDNKRINSDPKSLRFLSRLSAAVKNMKKRQNDFDDEDILDIVDEAFKEAYVNTDERLIIWPNGERLTVDQSAEKIKGENDLDNEVVKDCIMAWV